MAEYIEREVTCNDCLHYGACLHILKAAFPNVTDEEIAKVASRNNGCALFKNKTDVVEVVRCKDCKHCDVHYPVKNYGEEAIKGYYCKVSHGYRDKDFFCGYGAKMDGKGETK